MTKKRNYSFELSENKSRNKRQETGLGTRAEQDGPETQEPPGQGPALPPAPVSPTERARLKEQQTTKRPEAQGPPARAHATVSNAASQTTPSVSAPSRVC